MANKTISGELLKGKVRNFLDLYRHRLGYESFARKIEELVLARTALLEEAIGQLKEEIAKREELGENQRHTQNLTQTRLDLLDYANDHTISELLIKGLDQTGFLVDSPVGFYHFVEADQETISLQQWSTRTAGEFCRTKGDGRHYPIEGAGVWADCVRLRKPVVHNDYQTLPAGKGLPEGHPRLVRELVVPVIRQGKIVAILGLGNKPVDYNDQDVETVSYLADVIWQVVVQKMAENQLRDSEEKYRVLFQEMLDGFALHEIICDEQGKAVDYRFLDVNPAFEKITGLKGADIIGRTVKEVLPGIENSWIDIYGKVALYGEPILFDNYSDVIGKHLEVKAFQPAPGQFSCLFADKSRDIQDQLERERMLAAIEQAEEAIVITDVTGMIQYVNPVFAKVSGYDIGEIIGSNSRILKSGMHDQEFYRDMWETIARGRTWKGRLINRRKDGTIYTEDTTISPVRDSAGAIVNYVGVKRDITEHLRLAAQVQQIQKLEAIGTLAGGIAHDFNNILSAILGYSDMVLEQIGERGQVGKDLQQVISAANRAVDLVKQILTISRRQEVQCCPTLIQDIINEALQLLRPTISTRVEIRTRIDQQCPPVMADPTEIYRVAMNLCTNAYHAILARGEADLQLIEIVLQQVELSEAEVYGLGDHLKPGRYVRLTITDSGCGMEPEIMKRVFDPYFSTKKVGEGTGLGLATVHSIVIGCGGAIKLKSEPGAGTTFEVFFPQGLPSPALPGRVFDELPAGSGNERVMVVDDEVPVLELESRILEKAGYRVTSFSDSFEALAWFRQNPAAFDLIISDLNMPRILGTDLARSILEARPDLPIVLVSGYTDKDNIQKMKDIGIREFLYKPVERDTLLKAARRNLPKVSVGRNASN